MNAALSAVLRTRALPRRRDPARHPQHLRGSPSCTRSKHIAEHRRALVCANERCNRLFTRQRGRAQFENTGHSSGVIYCSNLCAKAQAERVRRARKRAEKPRLPPADPGPTDAPPRQADPRDQGPGAQARGRSASRSPKGGRAQAGHQTTFDTYEEAEQFYAQAQLGDVVPRTRDTFDDWADRWLERKEASGVRPNTMAGYRSDLTHPREAFGSYRIQDITEDQVEHLVRTVWTKGKSKRTIGKMLGTLRSVFQLAMRKNVLEVNPAADVSADGRPHEPATP